MEDREQDFHEYWLKIFQVQLQMYLIDVRIHQLSKKHLKAL